jgi:protein-S-isoprenylcysteine O-methyltransferase Ste14
MAPELLSEFPFLLTLVLSLLAGLIAIALRRAAMVFGRWLRLLSRLMALCAYASLLYSFVWAWTPPPSILPATRSAGTPWGWVVAAPGAALMLWSLISIGRRAVLSLSPSRFHGTPPYSLIRRPLELGIMLAALGVTVVKGTPAAWLCLVIGVLVANLLMEVRDREQLGRRGSAYLRHTPRYLPRRGKGDPPDRD